uniref:uncharacterized protein n=1 Tax=Semicossyphus pulcher TaxID=241346 RepID=UPI0037E92377
MSSCDFSASYPCARGYLSSDSDDDEKCCQPCLQTPSSCMDQTCCADIQNLSQGSQGNPKQKLTKPRLLTPLLKPKMNSRDDQEVAVQNVACPDKALSCKSHQTGNSTVQFETPRAPAQTQSSKQCKCTKTSNATRDAGTQTGDKPTTETRDASTQCSFVARGATIASGLKSCLPPLDVSVQQPATGRQTEATAKPNTHTPSSGNVRIGGKHTPWNKKKSRASSGKMILNTFPAKNSNRKGILQRPIHPFVDALRMTDGRGKENREGRDERGREENGRLMKDPSNEVREEVTSTTRVNRLSEETETLQEIADILLLLKHRKEEEH